MVEVFVNLKEPKEIVTNNWRIYLHDNEIYLSPIMNDWNSDEFEITGYDWIALVKIAIEIGSGDYYHFPLLLGFNETSLFKADVLLAQDTNEIWQSPPKKVKFLSDAEIEALPQGFMKKTRILPLSWREIKDVLIGRLPFYDPKVDITEVNSIMESLRRIRAIEGEWDEMYFPAKGLFFGVTLGYVDDAPCDSPYDEDCPPPFRWAELILINQRKGKFEWLGIVENPPIFEEDRPLFFVGKWETKTEYPLENWMGYRGLLATPDNHDVYHWKEVK